VLSNGYERRRRLTMATSRQPESENNDAECINGQEPSSMPSIATQPSAIFSTTSSSSALSCFDGLDQACDENYDFACDDNDDDVLDIDSCHRDCRIGALTTEQRRSELPQSINTTSTTNPCSWKKLTTQLVVFQVFLFLFLTLSYQASNRLLLGSRPETTAAARNAPAQSDEDCIYVPGGGFSGFWFSMGRLQSLDHPQNERFVCYSAGCLGVVSILRNHFENKTGASNNNQYERLYEYARSIQTAWQAGTINRYRVVEVFVDGILEKLDESTSAAFLETIRRNVHIVTTAFGENDTEQSDHEKSSFQWLSSSSLIPRATLQQPLDIPSLKRMLLQTTWIPLATGSSWTHRGHMDGAFSIFQHPRCRKTVGLTLSAFGSTNRTSTMPVPSLYESFERSATLWTNTLNININKQDVKKLWTTGLDYGV